MSDVKAGMVPPKKDSKKKTTKKESVWDYAPKFRLRFIQRFLYAQPDL